jgi:hypothetical protein
MGTLVKKNRHFQYGPEKGGDFDPPERNTSLPATIRE